MSAKFLTTVNVRASPSTSSSVVAKYNKGETVKYDQTVENEGRLWISYIGKSGNRRYCCAKDTNGEWYIDIGQSSNRNNGNNYSGNKISFTVTGYCPCKKCCGKTDGITASGVKAKSNHTLAAPNTYAFGTKIVLEGYGTFVVEDRGSAIQGNKLDRFFDTHQEALNWGVKNCTGYIA